MDGERCARTLLERWQGKHCHRRRGRAADCNEVLRRRELQPKRLCRAVNGATLRRV
jgi:hypothetical protein